MDIMNSKKTLLSLINGGAVLGAPAGGNTVKFQFATSIATAAASQTAGALTFAADSNGNAAIYAQGTLVSSKIQNVAAAAASGAKHGGKTITVTYIGAAGAIETSTFDVIDEAALEAYFSGSKTITLDTNNGRNIYEVITDGVTILVDESNGLKSGLKIAYVAEHDNVGAQIQLQDKDGNIQGNAIEVSDIVGDGVLKDSIYHQDTNVLELRFGNGKVYNPNDPTTYTAVTVNLQKLIDINDVFIGTDSSIYLDATLDASTVTLNTKMQDPSTASANATGLADAWKVKQYVDSKSTDLAVEAESRDTYLDASVLAANNKKVWVAAQVADLTIAAGVAGGNSDSSLSGTSGKLVDAADAASKVQSFVNARLDEEVKKLDASIDSTGNTFVEVGVAEVDGKITSVVVHENIGTITGSATSLSGETGIADAAATATAVKTYVDGQINALDASVDSDDATYTKVGVKQVDGKITDVVVSQTKSTITASASALSATEGIADGQEFATGVKTYVDGRLDASIQALDASITADTTGHDISIYLEEVDGVVTTVGVEHTAATVTFTAADGGHPANLEGSGSFVMASDIATIKNYVDAVAGALDSSVEDTDNGKGYVYVKTVQENGALDEQIVNVTYGEITATAGAIQIDNNGIIDSSVLKEAIEGALTWTVLP